ncbi:unnamed protein product [Ilex paraguariensis]|uniref:Uncharacterized protein n=1 Tax=Ilex paraguariensis TaxID=185542 RepID=A0ABC8TN50_9AQUA
MSLAVSNSAPATKTVASAPVNVVPFQTLPPAPTFTDITSGFVPAPQADASTAPADIESVFHSANSFSASIDELFEDIGGGISSEVIGPPGV